MHDARALLDRQAAVQLARRGYALDAGMLAALVEQRSGLISAVDTMRAELKRAARGVASNGSPATGFAGRTAKEKLRELEERSRECEAELRALLLSVPNLPDDDAPDGRPSDP